MSPLKNIHSEWMQDKTSKTELLTIVTAQSDPISFKPLFGGDGQGKSLLGHTDDLRANVAAMRLKQLASPDKLTQSMLDLFILAISWLLIFDKVCVCALFTFDFTEF